MSRNSRIIYNWPLDLPHLMQRFAFKTFVVQYLQACNICKFVSRHSRYELVDLPFFNLLKYNITLRTPREGSPLVKVVRLDGTRAFWFGEGGPFINLLLPLLLPTGMHSVRDHVCPREEGSAHGPQLLLRSGECLHHTSRRCKLLTLWFHHTPRLNHLE